VSAGVVQPLLRGFGTDVNRTDLELSRNQFERTLHDQKAELLLIVAGTEQAYWDLEEAWSRLRIQELLTEQGVEVERVLAERRSFDAAMSEYSDAQATVERRRADLLRAERIVKRASDRLKALMNSERYPPGGEALLAPSARFDTRGIEYQLRDAVATGLAERPEIRRALLAIEDARLRERLADNLLLPRLDLMASVTVNGLDEEVDSSYSSLAGDDVWSYLVGLSFSVPIGNRAAEAEQRRSQLEQRASVLNYERLVLDVVVEVKEALRDVRTNYALIAATRSTRIAEAENLRALQVEEESRGRLTPEFLNLKFQRQERLALAQIREVEAMANYERALAAYYRAIGSGGALVRFLPPPEPPTDGAAASDGE
jgi:outer membrane protein TolC